MTKAEARKAYRDRRTALGQRDILRLQDLLLIRFQQFPFPALDMVHTYMPIEGGREPDPDPLVRWLQFRNPDLQVAVPKLAPDAADMLHLLVDEESSWTLNRWGIPEPDGGPEADIRQIDLVLVPLLAFDLDGQRVGYGKGFYDRFLQHCREDTIKLGLSFFEAEEGIEDTNTFDIRLNYVVTPDRIYAFE